MTHFHLTYKFLIKRISLCFLIISNLLVSHTVTFELGDNGTLLSGDLVQEVDDGGSPITPEISASSGWAFGGWNEHLSDISSDLTVAATYFPKDLAGRIENKLTATDGGFAHYFGGSVCINGDTAIVGASSSDGNEQLSGSAYIFVRNNDQWIEQAKLIASDGEHGDKFGVSVSISGDTAIVGANGDNSAYIFVRNNGVWSEEAKLTASDRGNRAEFGISVSISGDTAIVGAYWDGQLGSDSGSAYIFIRNNGEWNEEAKLTASDGAPYDNFGLRVSISNDTAVVGAHKNDNSNGSDSGSAYVYIRNNGEWNEQAKLIARDGAPYDYFGSGLSISGDTAIVGAFADTDNGPHSGSAYAFVRENGQWTEQAKLLASDGSSSDLFGKNVSISGDFAIISAENDDDNGGNSGSAYIFTRDNGAWTEYTKLTASDGWKRDSFGGSVSISNNLTIIGARFTYHDDNGSDSGSAYLFNLSVPPATVTFDLNDKGERTGGGELTQKVVVGTAATSPTLMPDAGWIFDGWDTDFSYVTSDLSILGRYSYDPADFDEDNISDGWEIVHLGSITFSDGTTDSDGDGDSDYKEFLSGNDPVDPLDSFHVMQQGFSTDGKQILLRIKTNSEVANRIYRVCYSKDMSAGSWAEIPDLEFSTSSGDFSDIIFVQPENGNRFFYRVEAHME